MGIAYVFCLVALFQVSLCQVTFNDTTDIASELSSTLGSETPVATEDQSTEPQDMSTVGQSTTTEEDNQETDNVPYKPEEADNTTTTTSTEQPKPEPASTSAPGQAASVVTHANALAVTMALCVTLLFQTTWRRVVDC